MGKAAFEKRKRARTAQLLFASNMCTKKYDLQITNPKIQDKKKTIRWPLTAGTSHIQDPDKHLRASKQLPP